MITHSNLLAWEIPWTEEPGRLQFMGSQNSQTWLSNQTTTKTFYFLFFKYQFIYFNWRLITLQYCIGFAIHQQESATRVPHPEPPSLLPPRSAPLGRPSAPAPSIQYHASNLDWRFISYMTLYMFQCHSSKPSRPLPLPQSPKGCFIHSIDF